MKKILLVIVLALGFALSSNAQNFGYGIEAGANISGIREDPDQLYLGSKFGFQLGAFADYYFSDNVYIKGDLIFITKGAKNEATVLGKAKISSEINPMYFQIPLVMGFSINATHDINVNFSLGGYIAYGIAGKGKAKFELDEYNIFDYETIGYFKETNNETLLYLGNNKRFDYGIRFGVGMDVNKLFFISLDFDLGLKNNYNDQYITKYYSKQNQTLGLTLGYRF